MVIPVLLVVLSVVMVSLLLPSSTDADSEFLVGRGDDAVKASAPLGSSEE